MVTLRIAKSIDQIPRLEVDSLATQEIPLIYGTIRFIASLSCSQDLAPVPTKSQINPSYTLQSYFLNINFNIIPFYA